MTSIKNIGWLILVVSCFSCRKSSENDFRVDKRVSLWRNDDIPYGLKYTFRSLPQLFPGAEIITENQAPSGNTVFSPSAKKIQQKISEHEGKTLQIIISRTVDPNALEIRRLLEFVQTDGNSLFISAFYINSSFLEELKLKAIFTNEVFSEVDSAEMKILDPNTAGESVFSYPGYRCSNYFSEMESEYVSILGRNENGYPNFIKIKYTSGGSLFLHLAPLAFTNYFLLHKDNKKYLDYVASYLPKDVELIDWAEYYRTSASNRNQSQGNGVSTALSWINKQPALSMALWLLVLLLALIYLFESKRKQRIIPEKRILKNSSLEFVKTIGRLYYQRRDNQNLAAKMTAHFLDHVRSRYNLSTNRTDEEFVKKLAFKTGIDYQVIHDIVYQSKYLADQEMVSDTELLQYNSQLENFYKQA